MLRIATLTVAGAVVVVHLAATSAAADDRAPAAERQALVARFQSQIWPLLNRDRGGKSCVGCHAEENPAELIFLPDAKSNFVMLLDNGYFDPDDPASLLARVTAPSNEVRMPPNPLPPIGEDEIKLLRVFTQVVFNATGGRKSRLESAQRFPAELLTPWEGPRQAPSPPATFLTFRQLKGKVLTIFGDPWHRSGKDMFADNVHLFGGADFQTRHNENSQPTAGFLSALEQMAGDVASRAYLQSSGPLQHRPQSFPPPEGMDRPEDIYLATIEQLYRRILLRRPSEEEVQDAFRLVRDVYAQHASLARRSYTLQFEVTVKDPKSGPSTTEGFQIRIRTDRHGLYQQFIDQSLDSPGAKVELELPGTFHFAREDEGQMLRISNTGTDGDVSIAGVQLTGPGADEAAHFFGVMDPGVEVDGAWSLSGGDDFSSFEDGNRRKGHSFLSIPIRVDQDGHYRVHVVWRKNTAGNAKSVLVEIISQDRTQLAAVKPPAPAPPGEAVFAVDQTDDTIAFTDLRASFRFASELDFVEINNAGTRQTVTADAVKFLAADSGSEFLIDNPDAVGQAGWKKFTSGTRAFNRVGSDSLTDGNQKKGELRLAYKPAIKEEWDAAEFYRIFVSFPAKGGHDTRTPVIVRAAASSPIVRLRYPRQATVGAEVELDASHTYNIQRTPLEFAWRQVGGPQVALNESTGPKVSFNAPDPAESGVQTGWETLVQALLMHPDFLFTRSPSLSTTADPVDRRRLQLGKIALDLVGRAPTEEEITQLDGGASLESSIDAYLKSDEFADFYFHRIRLLRESHGSRLQDEPVRLWCYVALGDRPFQEILTADYSVDGQMQRQPRPDYHGKTGILTTKGFMEGKPGLPHFNYAAQVAEKFLGHVFEVPPEIVNQRDGITAISTTNPTTVCYSCHKLLTPLAYQRLAWSDDGTFRTASEDQQPIDDSDRGLVPSYPFAGKGMEAFATKAVNTEQFVRTMIDTHFAFYFGRQMRYRTDERDLYKRLWDAVHADGFTIRGLVKAILTSPEYLDAARPLADPAQSPP